MVVLIGIPRPGAIVGVEMFEDGDDRLRGHTAPRPRKEVESVVAPWHLEVADRWASGLAQRRNQSARQLGPDQGVRASVNHEERGRRAEAR